MGRTIKKALASLIILLFAVSTSGCSYLDGLNFLDRGNSHIAGEEGENGFLNIYDLVQKLSDSIRNESEIENIYGEIPQQQRDDLTLDEYQQYIRLLKRGIPGEISSFSLMNEKDLEEQRETIIASQPENQELVNSLRGAWLYYREIGRAEQKFAVFVSSSENGFYTLGGQWVRGVLSLYDMARLYFDAIERNEPEALAILIRTDDRPDDILAVKAEKIINFYHNNISSRFSEYVLKNARIDSIVFEQFGILNPDQTQSVSRNIEISFSSDQGYYIDDVIPDNVNLADLDIYFNGQLIIRFAAYEENEPVIIDSSSLESVIGEPLLHDDTNCVDIAGGSQRMTLEYDNIELVAEGTCFRHSRWEGQIRQLTLKDSLASLGSGIKPGDPVYDILRQYPFADETEYQIKSRVDTGYVNIMFVVWNDAIWQINLEFSAN